MEQVDKHAFQGSDPQYVSPTQYGAPPSRTPPSRIDASKTKWQYTNGSKVRPGRINMNASPGTLEAGSPWYLQRGIASPRSASRLSNRSERSSRTGGSGKGKGARIYEWYSIVFFGIISLVYLGMFILSLGVSDWEIASMNENPWFGATSEALVKAGALVVPLMDGPTQEWWRLFASIFLPAGVIQMAICIICIWIFGLYSRTTLPYPQVSVAGVFLATSMLGSLASANLNTQYVSCGAFAGIAGLFGNIMISQALNWPRRKLLNLREWYLVALVLIAGAGGLLVLSVLPLVDVWFTGAGLLAGMLLSFVIIAQSNKNNSDNNRVLWLVSQITSGLLLFGLFVAACVGCALTPKLGDTLSFLQDASCINFSSESLECNPYGYLASGCGLGWNEFGNSTVGIYCPGTGTLAGTWTNLADLSFSDIGVRSTIQQACTNYCG